MSDAFLNVPPSLSGPASTAFAVTPSDSTEFPAATRALYIGGNGNVAVKTMDGQTVTFRSAVAGSLLPVRVLQVLATGTTATGIVGLS